MSLRFGYANQEKVMKKGHVERSVDFIRRKAFSAVYSFQSLNEASMHLETTLEKLNKRTHHEHKVHLQNGMKYFMIKVLTAVLTDRLTHKSHVLNMNSLSFRMRETEEWLKNESN